MDTFSLDDFDNPPPPPRYLYKYLPAEWTGHVSVPPQVLVYASSNEVVKTFGINFPI